MRSRSVAPGCARNEAHRLSGSGDARQPAGPGVWALRIHARQPDRRICRRDELLRSAPDRNDDRRDRPRSFASQQRHRPRQHPKRRAHLGVHAETGNSTRVRSNSDSNSDFLVSRHRVSTEASTVPTRGTSCRPPGQTTDRPADGQQAGEGRPAELLEKDRWPRSNRRRETSSTRRSMRW